MIWPFRSESKRKEQRSIRVEKEKKIKTKPKENVRMNFTERGNYTGNAISVFDRVHQCETHIHQINENEYF